MPANSILEPVSGSELAEPFKGPIRFNQVSVQSDLPDSSSTTLNGGGSYTFHVTVKNTGLSSEAFFIDPLTSTTAPVALTDINGSDQNMSSRSRRGSPSRSTSCRRTPPASSPT